MPTVHPAPHPVLRAACLRSVAQTRDGPRAVVSLSAEQHLVLPLRADELARWQARVGQRVWLDLDTHPLRLQAEPLPGRHHG